LVRAALKGCRAVTNPYKNIALVLVLIAVGWLVAVGGFVLAGYRAGRIDVAAAALGLGIFAFFPALVALVVGGVVWAWGRRVDRELQDLTLERLLLERLEARGQLSLPELAAELRVSPEALREAVYRAAAKNLLTGYVNWQEQKLYSAEVGRLGEHPTCPNCGGQLELAGKGVLRCPYCGSEVFLPRPDER
jgi:hypothetical protein